jgi:hypothetical protein
MSTPPNQPSEEEMRAAYEAEIKKLRVEDVLLQTVVSLINLAGRKAGLAEGTEDERDPAQLSKAIDGAMALLPLVEDQLQLQEAAQIRQALSQLQQAFAQMPGAGEAGSPAERAGAPEPGQPQQSSAQQSGRLWVPGQ